MRNHIQLHNGNSKIENGRFGGDTSRIETKWRRHDLSSIVRRNEQHERQLVQEAIAEAYDVEDRIAVAGVELGLDSRPRNEVMFGVDMVLQGVPVECLQRKRETVRFKASSRDSYDYGPYGERVKLRVGPDGRLLSAHTY
jgi:hypothetical protein